MSPSPRPSVSQFIDERKFLKNCTPKTQEWHSQALLKAFAGCTTEPDYKARIVELRQRGVSAISVNSWLRSVNAYLAWSNAGFKLPRLKEETKILATFSQDQVSKLLAYKPKSKTLQRAQVLAGLLLDTGLRIAEALALRRSDVDLDNCLVTTMGKGRKERKIPISMEGRRRLYLHLRNENGVYVFGTRLGSPLTPRNAQRDLANLCRRAGITGVRTSPHTLRHSFAVNYLRRGGNLEFLRRCLGHSSILVTQRYLQSLTPEDLQSSHISPLDPKGGK